MEIVTAIDLALALITRAMQISALVQKAQAAGRTNFTPEEWAEVIGADDAARKRLADAVSN